MRTKQIHMTNLLSLVKDKVLKFLILNFRLKVYIFSFI